MTGKEFGAIIARLASRYGWREQGQSAAARLLGCSRASISRWIGGERALDPLAARLAFALERDPGLADAIRVQFGE